jgi:protein-disulfide isomerase
LIAEGKLAFTYVPLHSIGGIPGGDLPARAALCAGQQDKFWEYHDALFGWQDFGAFAFAYDRLIEGAVNLDLDASAFETCLNGEDTLPTLDAAQSFAQGTPGFTGTPTILLNGEIVNWSPIPALLEQINAVE